MLTLLPHLAPGFSAKLKIWQVSTCKMEPRSGNIFCKNIYVAAAPIYVAAAPIYVAAAPTYMWLQLQYMWLQLLTI